MFVPLNWIKEYVDLPKEKNSIRNRIPMIGHLLNKNIIAEDGEIVLDLELRGNRADCYGLIGLARDIAAAFEVGLKIPKVKEIKDQYKTYTKSQREVEINVTSEGVSRFYSIEINNIKVKESPKWIQDRLKQVDITPINNIVDITNYVMIESGMPMHAFDKSLIADKNFYIRNGKKGDSFKSFDGGNLQAGESDIVFADNKNVLGFAGIVGSKDSGVNKKTSSILLECANYDRVTIRKTMFRVKAFTEAGTRHSHDLSSTLCEYALKRATDLILEIAGDKKITTISEINDFYPAPLNEKVLEYNINEVERLGGIKVDKEEQIKILERLEFKVIDSKNDILKIKVPDFRTDIFESADIVEEVLRIYGYEHIPSTSLSSEIPKDVSNKAKILENEIKDSLVRNNLNEIISTPFFSSSHEANSFYSNINLAIPLVNPPSLDYALLRINLYHELLQITARHLKRGDTEIRLFESGVVFEKKNKRKIHQPPHKPDFPYLEFTQTTGLITSRNNSVSFYDLKGVLENVFYDISIDSSKISYKKATKKEFNQTYGDILYDSVIIGEIGEFSEELTAKFGIKNNVFLFTLYIDNMVALPRLTTSYTPYSQFPSVSLDISIYIDSNNSVTGKNILDIVAEFKTKSKIIKDYMISDVYFDRKDGSKSLLLSIIYQSKERTLTTDEVNLLHTEIGDKLIKKFHITIKGRI